MPPVEPQEHISRFIFSSGHFSTQHNRVKHNAFMPVPNDGTSVFRTSSLSEPEVWSIGQAISTQRDQQLHARGDLFARQIFALSLGLEPSEPPPRHANITGWPQEKDKVKLKAMEVAAQATLRLLP